MKLKAAITGNCPDQLLQAFGSEAFARRFLDQVVGVAFEIDNPTSRPAEFYVQQPDRTVAVGDNMGVEVRLTGVSRSNRPAKMFHSALQALNGVIANVVAENITGDQKVQIFVVLMLDAEVETSPGSGTYSNVLEADPTWITANSSNPDQWWTDDPRLDDPEIRDLFEPRTGTT